MGIDPATTATAAATDPRTTTTGRATAVTTARAATTAATHARKATTPGVAAAAEWVSSTSFPGRSKDLVMTIAKKPRVQMKMSNSVSEASTAVTQGIPVMLIVKLLLGTQPPPPSSPWSHLVCERALIPLKAIIIKIPFISSPTPSHHNPPDPECIPSHCVTPNGNKNREIAEEIR